ncbi:MAG: glycosyltransferase [Bacteroidaceae bacterium]|nr:glycosyltransferase [Bacteroidaceae bacterium]
MAKKKILVVVMSLSTGGTTSALKALMQTSLSKDNDISILIFCNTGVAQNPELQKYIIMPGKLAQLWFLNIANASLLTKILMLPIKVIKNTPWLGNRIDTMIAKHIAKSVERKAQYDTVISFAENTVPGLVQHFGNENKIVWVHCDYGNRVKREEEHIFSKYRKIVCVSKFTRDSFAKRYPSLDYKTEYVYNVCSFDSIKAKSKEDINDKQFDTSVFTIISIGRIATVKRFHKIPEIAKRLKDTGCTFKWYIMGGGSAEDTDKIKTAIESNGVSGEVIMLGARSNPYPYIKRANLLVSTSESEACPMIFNEAKILGIPIVSSNFGSSYEFIKQGTDGYITSIEEMHKVIEKLITDKTEYSKLAPVADKELLEETIIAKINNII